MARPIETGLSYFPLDIDFDYDDKFQMMLAKHKAEGCWIVLVVLCKIYNEGYFYKWTEKEQLLTARRVNSDLTTVVDVINDAIIWEIFNQEMFDKFSILTSNGIQKRFFEATKKRKHLKVFGDYLVIDKITAVNSKITIVNPELSTQRKEKESRVKENRIEENRIEKNKRNIFSEDSNEIKLSKLLYDKLCLINPYQKTPNFQAWAKEIDLTIRVDARTLEMLTGAINWTFSDPFWSTVIQSPKSLRKNFDKLYTNAKRDKNGTARSGITEDVLRERARIIASDPDLRRD